MRAARKKTCEPIHIETATAAVLNAVCRAGIRRRQRLDDGMPEIERQFVLEQVVGVVGADVNGRIPGGAADGKIAVQVILGFVPMVRRLQFRLERRCVA